MKVFKDTIGGLEIVEVKEITSEYNPYMTCTPRRIFVLLTGEQALEQIVTTLDQIDSAIELLKAILANKPLIQEANKKFQEEISQQMYDDIGEDELTPYYPLVNGKHIRISQGICGVLSFLDTGVSNKILRQAGEAWIDLKGLEYSPLYPVDGEKAFYNDLGGRSMWLNDSRWEYAEFVVNYLTGFRTRLL